MTLCDKAISKERYFVSRWLQLSYEGISIKKTFALDKK